MGVGERRREMGGNVVRVGRIDRRKEGEWRIKRTNKGGKWKRKLEKSLENYTNY